MLSKTFLFLALLMGTFVVKSNAFCNKISWFNGNSACGEDCTGRPGCAGRKCGNIDNVCYCDCSDGYTCKPTELGYKWNNGAKLSNGSYAFNGHWGDGKHYDCA